MNKALAAVLVCVVTLAAHAEEAQAPAVKSAPLARQITGHCVIRGEVLYGDGRKAAGASVQLVFSGMKGRGIPQPDLVPRETTADADGRFEFANLPPSEFQVLASTSDGLAMQYAWFTSSRKLVQLRMELEPAGPLSGTVRDANGNPVAGATVYPYQLRSREQPFKEEWADALAVSTDPNGAFSFKSVYAGEWSVRVVAEGYAPSLSDYAPVGAANVAVVLRSGGQISGKTVNSATKGPTSGVELVLQPAAGSGEPGRATTDAKGAFRFQHVPSGQYKVYVEDDMFVAEGVPPFVTVTESGAEELDVPVAMGGSISGTVVDEATGKGIPGAWVNVGSDSTGPGLPLAQGPVYNRTFQADDKGHYRAGGLLAARYNVGHPSAEGYRSPTPEPAERSVVVRVGEDTAGVDFALNTSARVSGILLDSQGKPLAGIHVSARANNTTSSTESGPDGEFDFDSFSPCKEFTISARGQGWCTPRVLTMELPQTGLSDLKLTLMPATGVLAGRLVTRDGSAASGVRIVAQAKQEAGSEAEGVLSHLYTVNRTGALGQFRLTGLPAGTYNLVLQPRTQPISGGLPPLATVTLSEGEVREDLLVVADGGSAVAERVANAGAGGAVSGRVTDTDGKPLAGAHVQVEELYGAESVTNAEGAYVIPIGVKGYYRVRASSPGYSPAFTKVEVPGAASVNFTLARGGVLQGRVVQASNGRPLPQFEVLVLRTASKTFENTPGLDTWRLFSDPNGRFVFDGMPEGLVTITARAAGLTPASTSVAVAPAQTTSGITLALESTIGVRGTVRTKDGRPVAGAIVVAGTRTTNPASWPQKPPVGVTDADGSFRASGLPAGVDCLAAIHPDYFLGTVLLDTTPGKTVRANIELEEGGVLSGHVYLDGKPASRAELRMTYAGTPGVGERYIQSETDGTYEFRSLVKGRVRLKASPSLPAGQPAPQLERTIDLRDPHTRADLNIRTDTPGQ